MGCSQGTKLRLQKKPCLNLNLRAEFECLQAGRRLNRLIEQDPPVIGELSSSLYHSNVNLPQKPPQRQSRKFDQTSGHSVKSAHTLTMTGRDP